MDELASKNPSVVGTDWFKKFAADMLTQCIGLTRDQLLIYFTCVLLVGAGQAPLSTKSWQRKLSAFTGVPPTRIDTALEELGRAGKILKCEDGTMSVRVAP